MADSSQILSSDGFQGAPLRDNLDQHRLDSLSHAVEAVLLLPQSHEAKEEIKPLRK